MKEFSIMKLLRRFRVLLKRNCKDQYNQKGNKLQPLCSEIEMLRMKSGEPVSEFFSRTKEIINKMRVHGDKVEEVTVIKKILRSMTPKFNFVVCSSEESKDLDHLSIDELQGSLFVHEQKIIQ